ncbi:MAG: AAA family ATPase [Zoogloeaceae bacterium]|jgi:hypothetical protein|nr:AAA family ATPase [Zoogloeaceae bacterium]
MSIDHLNPDNSILPVSFAMPRKKLPIGIQTFREIHEDDCYYVDKTAFALRMIRKGKAYFLVCRRIRFEGARSIPPSSVCKTGSRESEDRFPHFLAAGCLKPERLYGNTPHGTQGREK